MLYKSVRSHVLKFMKVIKKLSCIKNVLHIESSFKYIDERIDELKQKCIESLMSQGFTESSISTVPYLHLRYDKTDCALMCTAHPSDTACRHGDFLSSFTSRLIMYY